MTTKMIQFCYRRHYLIIVALLIVLAIYPVYNFFVMAGILSGRGQSGVTAVIPFMAVTLAILIGFILIPLLKGVPLFWKHIIISAIGILVFVGLDILAQHVAANESFNELMLSRAPRFDLTPLYEGYEQILLEPPRLFLDELFNSRMPRFLPPSYGDYRIILDTSFINNTGTISWQVRIHYYIFSIILVVAALNWLINLTGAILEKKNPPHRFLVLQGIAVLCYTLAYLLVRVVRYEDHAARHIAWGSVLNSAICFMLAAVAVGLYSGSLLHKWGRVRLIVPAIMAAVTVLALYLAQFIMLGGGLYNFGNSAFIAYVIRIAIAVFPGIVVYWLLRVAPA